jgi:hypothetical protein
MTEQTEQATAEVTEEYLLNFLDTLTKMKVVRTYGTSLNESEAHTLTTKLQGTAAYLSARSNQRQEQILNEQHEVLKSMKKQSDSMRCHSWTMIVLTVVILAAMGLQIFLACKQLNWI